MPFRSQKQRKWMFAAANRGEISMNMPHEWAHHTKNMGKLPEHVKHNKHAMLKVAYLNGVSAANLKLFGKRAAEDFTRHPPDDEAGPPPKHEGKDKPPSKPPHGGQHSGPPHEGPPQHGGAPPHEPHMQPLPPDEGGEAAGPPGMGGDPAAAMGDMGLPPELANLTPEQLEEVLLAFGPQNEEAKLESAGVDIPNSVHQEMQADGFEPAPGGAPGMPPAMGGAPPHGDPAMGAGGPGGPGAGGPGMGGMGPEMPPAMSAGMGQAGMDPAAMDPAMAGAGANKPTAEDFVSFAQSDATNDETDPNKPPPTAAGTIPEKPVGWGGNSSLEGGDAGTRNYQMGLPRSGAA